MNKLENNYTNFNALDIAPGQKYIALRTSPTQGEEPLSWQQFDYNFELLRYTLNEVIDEFAVVRSEFTYDEEITSIQNQATAIQQDLSSNYYTKADSDTRFQPLGDYQPAGDYALASDITPHTDAYTKVESDAKYALTGTTGGSLPQGYVLADDFCVGDGVTDDRANLQAAIDSLGAAGGTVLLGNKTYLLASNDGTMPWDLIPSYINTDQSLRGNAPDGSLDGTEDHTHPAFRLYAYFRDAVSDDAAGFAFMVGTWNGTEFSGGADSSGFNYWAQSNRAALSLWQGLYQAEYEGSDEDTRHVVVREHVTIRGCQDSCGPGVWRGDNIGATVNSKGSYIKIRNSTTLAMKRDTALANLTVVNDGLNGLVSSFGGYGVRPSGDDITIENCFIGGFEYGVYANWTNPDPIMKGNNWGTGGRLRISSCNMDNINSILVAGSYDITYIDKVHSWPFLTGHPLSNPDQTYTWDWNFFNNRDGIAFNLLEVNDWTKITDCFSYGYRTGFNIKGGRNIILKGCGADNSSVGMTRGLYEDLEEAFPDPDYNVLPGSIGFNITRNFASSEPVYGDYNAQGITDTDGSGFIEADEKFYPGTGSACLSECQAAAQETGFRFEMENNECATMTACQSWYCSTHISASASATVSVMNELIDTGGYKNPQGVGPVGITTQDTARVLVTNVQWREISYGGTDYNFSNKTVGNNITVTGEQNV
jgi:hypothetical protein